MVLLLTATTGAVVKEICSGKLAMLQHCAGALLTGHQQLLLQAAMALSLQKLLHQHLLLRQLPPLLQQLSQLHQPLHALQHQLQVLLPLR
jgi:hypothetical protein